MKLEHDPVIIASRAYTQSSLAAYFHDIVLLEIYNITRGSSTRVTRCKVLVERNYICACMLISCREMTSVFRSHDYM